MEPKITDTKGQTCQDNPTQEAEVQNEEVPLWPSIRRRDLVMASVADRFALTLKVIDNIGGHSIRVGFDDSWNKEEQAPKSYENILKNPIQ